MSPVYLKYYNGAIIEGNQFSLESLKPILTTKLQTEGRWYFEVTHISGNDYPCVGFCFDGGVNTQSFVMAHNKQAGLWHIVYYDNINVYMNSLNPLTSYNDIPELGQYQSQFTMGFAYDIYTHLFTVYYNNNFYHFNISCKNSCSEKISPVFIEATSGSSLILKDDLKVNFGSEPFVYGLPDGYLPWNSYLPTNTCYTHNYFQTHIFCIYTHVFILFCSTN